MCCLIQHCLIIVVECSACNWLFTSFNAFTALKELVFDVTHLLKPCEQFDVYHTLGVSQNFCQTNVCCISMLHRQRQCTV